MLLPGLLLPSRMHEPLARDLADRGNRVITLDLLGHGESDRPRDMWRYSMPIFAREVVALLDHLELDEAVVGGTSLGANTTLEVASLAPVAGARDGDRDAGARQRAARVRDRLHAAADRAHVRRAGHARRWPRLLRRVPRVFGHYPNVFLDWVSREPGPSAAVLQGMFFGRTAPPREERKTFEAPAIVLGHPRDAIHPFSDAKMLAEELPNGRLIEANSLFELRLRPRAADERDRRVPGRVLDARAAPAQRRRRAAAPERQSRQS